MKTMSAFARNISAPWRFLVTPFGLVVSFVFIFGVYGETMATYCTQYAKDLEKKQTYVTEIREDVSSLENALSKNVKRPESTRAPDGPIKLNRLEITGAELAQLIPPSPRITFQMPAMCGTLSPEAKGATLKHRQETGRTLE